MALLNKRSLAIHSLACALFLTIAGSTYALAFSSQPQVLSSSPASSPSVQLVQQQSPQPPFQESQPSQIPQQQQQQVTTTTEGIIARGIIDSLIFTPSATWIATGNWTIGVNNGAAALVTTNMTWYNDNGTASHTHEILNFRPIGVGGAVPGQQQPILVQPDSSSVSLRGVVDVGANHRIVWKDVQSAIDIKKGGKILSISLNDTQTNHHFGGRPIFGIVTSFTHCSDVPGPNMEMLPPCLNIPILPSAPASQSAAGSSPPMPTNTASPTIAANNTVHSPTNFTARSLPSPSSLSSPSGNIPSSSRPSPSSSSPPAALNATGKSPFDILGG
ncbi:MAG: hypothetical protein WBQ25_20940 [Nitrososphaeraceae archaeon]